ncbi:MAG: precorrin-6y C5,15-methyltransferase (decarboxylating) subunit CbiE [Lamprocystis purpurea]|uniref:precorrin-6y C5,15-methyltransferase (decarboxylating) subunit CbiE n=1 Tax=Lamprocystis purpurea TaxID=61598 RepID=UPI0003647302|nr:precorrin-6y C5,15-methyltransferase (decarboxylating) subunit CbiE [Lamprocystis purpurea]MBV5273481.1 precorrin-6y C5,15-methyltransferase (decarboxylating) subunit CbiE [Lamprocystis purpurea]
MTEPCTLIGILDDGWPGLADTARARLAGAGCVIGAARTLGLVASQLAPGARQRAMDGALAQVPAWVREAQAQGLRVVVLATGDPLCHGIAGRLTAALGAAAIEVLPAPSTVQLAFARFQRPWQDARISSCHGAASGDWVLGDTPAHGLYRVLRAVARHPVVAVFTSPANGPDRIARALLTLGYGDEIRLSVAARLARPDEVLFPDLTLAQAAGQRFPEPNVLICERAEHTTTDAAVCGLDDRRYARQGGGDGDGDQTGLITKLEVRAVTLARLALRPDSVVWDIGAGSGSVGLEASRIAYDGHCWAIEKSAAQAADARANARRLRAGNYSLFEGRAPDGLAAWPDPDAVFIGGSGGALAELIQLLSGRLRPGGRLVMNFIALENLTTAIAALDAVGLTWDLTQLGVARSQPILGLHRLAALNPVWILSASRGVVRSSVKQVL